MGNAADLGGGMLSFQAPTTTLIDCSFEVNSARLGGGLFNNGSTIQLVGTSFLGNTAEITGGGFHTTQGSASIDGGRFASNAAGFDGRGLYNWSSSSLVDGCEFHRNSAGRGGGMVNFSAQPVFLDNAAGQGAAMFNWSSDAVTDNSTFFANAATQTGGALYASDGAASLHNCIVLGNSMPAVLREARTSLWITHRDLQGSGGSGPNWLGALGTDGGGNLDTDPLFVDPVRSNVRLSPASPCIDAGSNPSVPSGVTEDLDGNPRFVDDPPRPTAVSETGPWSIWDPTSSLSGLPAGSIGLHSPPGLRADRSGRRTRRRRGSRVRGTREEGCEKGPEKNPLRRSIPTRFGGFPRPLYRIL